MFNQLSLSSKFYPDAFERHGKSQFHHENFWRRQLRRFLLEVIKIEAAAAAAAAAAARRRSDLIFLRDICFSFSHHRLVRADFRVVCFSVVVSVRRASRNF